MRTIRILFLGFYFLATPLLLAQNIEVKKDLQLWAKKLSKAKNFSAKVAYSAPILDLPSSPKLPFSMEGSLDWNFPSQFFIKMKNALLDYQIVYEGTSATELVNFQGLSPTYTHYSNLEPTPIWYLLKAFLALEKSEVEFVAELERHYLISSKILPEGDTQWDFSAKDKESFYQSISIRKAKAHMLPKSIEVVQRNSKKSFILFRELEGKSQNSDLPFYIPWPEGADFRQIP